MKYLIFLIPVLLIFSCTKERMIKVKTINKVTGEPMPNVTIYIIEQFSNSNPNETVFDGKTDNNGDLVIDLKFKNNGKYTIYQAQVENSCWHNEKSVFLEYKENNNVTFEFAPCAQLKLKIDNVNCQGPGDEIFYQRHWLSANESTNGVTQTGCFSYDGSYFNVPMGAYKYTWEVTRNGVTDSFEEEFYIDEAGQYSLEILY